MKLLTSRASGSARFRHHHEPEALARLHVEGVGVVVHVGTILDGVQDHQRDGRSLSNPFFLILLLGLQPLANPEIG